MGGFLGFSELELRTYLILSLCWLSIVQVNLLEQPYARSLVHCSTPTNNTPGAEFSGSKYCGDRLHVINEGADLSGKGQSLEAFGRVLITFIVSSFADGGRRRAAILGQSLLLASTVLFFVAGFIEGLAIPIYVVAQGLQGMSGIGILDQIVTGDVALQSGDSVGVYNRKNTFGAVLLFVLAPPVLYVQFLEITNFTVVWLCVNALNLGALLLLIGFFPETLPEDKKSADTGIWKMACREVQSFRDLVAAKPFLIYRFAEQLCMGLGDVMSILYPFMMANFGISQFEALIYGVVPGLLLSPVFMPLAPALHRKMGYWQAWRMCYWYSKLALLFGVTGCPGCPYPLLSSFRGMPGIILCGFLQLPMVGTGSIMSGIEINLVGQEGNAKFQAIMQLIGHFTGCVTSYSYARLFNAEAKDPFSKMFPYYCSTIWLVLQPVIYFWGLAPHHKAELDKLTAEEAAKGTAPQEVSDKKTD